MDHPKKKILITGGAGFIGSRLAVELASRGHEVVVLDNLAPQIHGDYPERSPLFRRLAGKVRFVRGDVTSREDLLGALSGVGTVVHLAAETGTGQSMYAIRHYAQVNVGGTALLLDLIANERLPIERLLVASSRAIYGEGKYRCAEHGVLYPHARSAEAMARGQFEHRCPVCGQTLQMLPTDEDSALRPSSVYGITKLTQEQLVLTVGQALGISALAFRFQNVFGPGQSLSNPYTGILSIFSTRLRQNKPINIFEDGLETRDFVYIDDVVAALCSGVESARPIVDVLNVGSGVATSVLSVAHKLKDLLGGESTIAVSGQYRVGDIRHNVADIRKIAGGLGFAPSVTFDVGLERFVDWVRGEAVGIDRYEQSLAELKAKGLFK
jgi:dTDP-L-rhamnose 4-epimerase